MGRIAEQVGHAINRQLINRPEHHRSAGGQGDLTGIAWVALYVSMDSEAKWGQVVGNIVSEWTQIIGLVLLTKRLIERHSKESSR